MLVGLLVLGLSNQVNVTRSRKANFTVEAGRVLGAVTAVELQPYDLPGCLLVNELAQSVIDKYGCKWTVSSCEDHEFGTTGASDVKFGCVQSLSCHSVSDVCVISGTTYTLQGDPSFYDDDLDVYNCDYVKCTGTSTADAVCPAPALDTCKTVMGKVHKDEKWNGAYLHDSFTRYLGKTWSTKNPWYGDWQNFYCEVQRDSEKCSKVESWASTAFSQLGSRFGINEVKYAEKTPEPKEDLSGVCKAPATAPTPYPYVKPETSGKKQYKKRGFAGFNYAIELKEWSADVTYGDCASLYSPEKCPTTGTESAPGWWWVENVKKGLSATGKKSFKQTDFYGTVSGSKEINGFDSDLAQVYDYKTTNSPYGLNPLSKLLNPLGSKFVEYKCKFSYGGKNTLSVGGAIGICVAVSVVLCVVTALILYFVCIKASKYPLQLP
jgi:hypothetical protein